MQTANWPGLASPKMRSCRDHPRFLAFLLQAFFTCLVVIMPAACLPSPSSMQLNSTLLSNQTLLSPGGVFELGFYSSIRSDVTNPVFTLAIWYAQPTPANTVVWFPDRSLALSENASLSLSPQGDLQVYDNIDSPQLMWTSNTANLNVTMATMLDTGNLVVLNGTNHVVWQSFDSPTDTLLPNQSYAANNHVTMKAWQASGDWRDSPYSLDWDIVSTLNASWISKSEIYFTLEHPTNFSYWSFPTPSSSVFLTSEGEFQSVSTNLTTYTLIATSNSGIGVPNRLLRLTLDTDGNFRMYSWMNGSSNWEVEWEAVDDVCTIFGHCGPFAVCSNNGECTCPVGFQLINATYPRQGCSRVSSEALCSINNLVKLPLTDYPYSGDYIYYKDVEFEFCLQTCLSDCYCQAAIVASPQQSQGPCFLKRGILLSGQYQSSRNVYLRVAPQPDHPAGLSERSKVILVASTLGAGMVILGSLLCVLVGFSLVGKMKKSRLALLQLQKKWSAGKDAAVTVRFTFEEIQLITNNFAMEIGEGGFGAVFKGKIVYHIDHTNVAVKLLNEVDDEENEFINKVNFIGKIRHFHLVSLLGYCCEAEHRVLVYEFVEEGSLDKLLFQGDESKSFVLEWKPRFQIAIQTAQALAFLHDECDPSIVHCNVKPENILVDSMLCAKVADFGLSSIMTREQMQTNAKQVYNTCEYLAPEWTDNQMPVTSKTDVFGYGMLLLKLISGLRSLTTAPINDHLNDSYYPIWAYPYIETSSFMDVIDSSLTGIVNAVEVQRALRVAFWCINDEPRLRPSMAQVVDMLEGHVPVKVPVPRPNFLENFRTENYEDGYIGSHTPIDVRAGATTRLLM